MVCEYIKVIDKNGLERLEDLSGNLVIDVQAGELVFVNELTGNLNLEVLNENDLQITFADGRVLTLENIVALMGDNINLEDGSLFDALLTRLQFLGDDGLSEKTLLSIADVFELLDSAAAGNESEVFRDNETTTFGNVNTDNERRDFREENADLRRDFGDTVTTTEETDETIVEPVDTSAEVVALSAEVSSSIEELAVTIATATAATTAANEAARVVSSDPSNPNIASTETAQTSATTAASEATTSVEELTAARDALSAAATEGTDVTALLAEADAAIAAAVEAASTATTAAQDAEVVTDEIIADKVTAVVDAQTALSTAVTVANNASEEELDDANQAVVDALNELNAKKDILTSAADAGNEDVSSTITSVQETIDTIINSKIDDVTEAENLVTQAIATATAATSAANEAARVVSADPSNPNIASTETAQTTATTAAIETTSSVEELTEARDALAAAAVITGTDVTDLLAEADAAIAAAVEAAATATAAAQDAEVVTDEIISEKVAAVVSSQTALTSAVTAANNASDEELEDANQAVIDAITELTNKKDILTSAADAGNEDVSSTITSVQETIDTIIIEKVDDVTAAETVVTQAIENANEKTQIANDAIDAAQNDPDKFDELEAAQADALEAAQELEDAIDALETLKDNLGDIAVVADATETQTVSTTTSSAEQTIIDAQTAVDNAQAAASENVVISEIDDESDTGTSGTDNVTSDSTPTITGITDPGSSVVITNAAGEVVGTGIADEDGNYSIEITELADGTQTVTITATSEEDNTASTTEEIVIDTEISTPTADLSATSDTGVSTSDDITSSTTPKITGTTEANARVVITNTAGAVIASTIADSNGNYEVNTSELSNGEQLLTITATDDAGNSASTTQSITVDTLGVGSVIVDAITSDDILSASESAGNVTVKGSVSGELTTGDTVSFSVNGTSYSATVDGDGNWSTNVAGADLAADTNFTVTAVGTDAAGNAISVTADSTHTLDTTAEAGTVSVDTVTDDDVINASEAESTITVSGTALGGDISTGDTVSFIVNGTSYSTTVQNDGSWSTSVAGSDLAVDTQFEVSVNSTDLLGNEVTSVGTSSHTVDTETGSGTVSIDSITRDDILSASEASETVTVTGSVSGDLSHGDSISFSVNGTPYTGSVDSDGNWSVDVAGADLAADTSFTVTATGADTAGNPIIASEVSSHTVDTIGVGSVSVDAITSDDIINADEASGNITVTGSVSGELTQGASVSFTVNDTSYTGTVDSDGTWSVDVAGADLAADTSFTVSASGTDTAGNVISSSEVSTHSVDVSGVGSVVIDAITSDDIISAQEAAGTVSVTGSVSGELTTGDIISFTVNGTSYSSTVDNEGNWSVDVSGADLATDSNFTVTATGTDVAGNTITATEVSNHSVDVSGVGSVVVDAITADDIISASESAGSITITGSVSEELTQGDTVSFTLNENNYSTTVDSNGNWSVDVVGSDLAADASFTVTATGTDAAGNTITATEVSSHSVDVSGVGSVVVDSITADDIISASEASSTISITGSVTGELTQGDTVSFTVNGQDYSTIVGSDGTWSVDVLGSDLAADTEFTVTATGIDDAGNTITATEVSTHSVDTEGVGSVVVDAITSDDIISSSEASATVAITGSVSGELVEGDSVSFAVNGNSYSGTVDAAGNWSVDVSGSDLVADTSFTVTVTGSDEAGNIITASEVSTHSVDMSGLGSVVVDAITSDDVLNADEVSGTVTVTGLVSGELTQGDTVSFTVNGQDYSTIVGSDGTWSVDVSGTDLAADTSFTVTATGTDPAGNTITASEVSTHSVDVTGVGSVVIDAITDDDILNADESAGTVVVSGSVTGELGQGDTVSFTVNGNNYSATVDSSGNWSADVAGSDLIEDTSFTVTVSGYDAAGNSITSSEVSTHSVDVSGVGSVVINEITSDDIINAEEASVTVSVSGSVSGELTTGDTVSFTVNGTSYTGTVDSSGTWSVDVAGSDLAADSSFTVTVTGSDTAGNTITASEVSSHSVDTVGVGAVIVDAITSDDIINADEVSGTVSITGSVTGELSEGDSVTFTVNDTSYSGTVDSNGNWSVDVAGSDLAADTSFTVTASGTDSVGNVISVTADSSHSVDVSADAGTVTIDAITADDVINADEAGNTITVTGSAEGGDISTGDTVSFTVNGTDYTATVDSDGNWSADVSGTNLSADTSFTVSVSSTDAVGNTVTSSTTSTHTVDTSGVGAVVVDSITNDDVISASEASGTVSVTGSVTGELSSGDTVSFSVNGTSYSGTVDIDGNWSVDVAGSDLAADTSFTVTASGSDSSGNAITAPEVSSHSVDTSGVGSVVVDAITSDDIISSDEASGTVAVTGSVSGELTTGDTVSFSVNGQAYSGTVDSDGNWSVEVAGSDLAADTDFTVTASGSDAAGNAITASEVSTHSVDTAGVGSVIVDAITSDDIINADEASGTVAITGSVTGELTQGDTVSFTLNGQAYSGSVDSDGNWSVEVSGSDLVADTSFTVTASGSDTAGNTITATEVSTHSVDTAGVGSVVVDAITADDIINADEASGNVTVTGSVSGELSTGDTISFNVNGQDYTATVDGSGNWSADVVGADLAADTSFTVTATGTDVAGNSITATEVSTHSVDVSGSGSVSVDAITSDDIISASESSSTISVTGSVTGELSQGDTISFSVNGTSYSGTVNGEGNWSVNVAGSDLAADTSFTVTASGTDVAGNVITATEVSTHSVDTNAEAGTVTIDAITADDVINSSESGSTITVTGSAAGGDISTGDTVSFTVNGTSYSTTVDSDGNWSADVSGAALAADTSFTVSVSSSDTVGNSIVSSATSTHTVDTVGVGSVVVDSITSDDVISSSESSGHVSVTGSVSGELSSGDTVSFSVNGTSYSGTVDGSGNWSVEVAGSDLAADTSFTVTAVGTDVSGNPITASEVSTHSVDTIGVGTVNVDSITSDDIISASESSSTITVTGSVTGELAQGDTVSFSVNGTSYSGSVDSDGNWSVDVAGSDLAADTNFTVTASGTDSVGNAISVTADSSHSVDTTADAGTVTIDAITADDVINSDEAGSTITVTGSAAGGDISTGDTVSFTVNGTSYTTIVDSDGNWSADVSGSDLAADTSFDVSVDSSDSVGNTVTSTATSTHTVDLNDNPDAVDDTTVSTQVTTTTTIFSSTFEEHLSANDTVFVESVDGWTNTNSGEKIELRDESQDGGDAHGGEKYIELNTDATDTYSDASSISRTISTVDGASYELDFNFSPRPGYDADVNQFEVIVDGQSLGTYSVDGSGSGSMVWSNDSVTFTGTGSPMVIEFKETGSDNPDAGRGMLLDDISLTQSVTTTQNVALSTDEDTAITVDVLSNDTDTDNDSLTITQVQGQDVSSGQTVNVTSGDVIVGTAQVVNGKIVFTPDETSTLDDGENQDVTFAYTISDGQGGSDSANVTINVTGVTDNVAPDAVDDSSATTTVTVTETASDVNNLGGGSSQSNTQTLDFGSEYAGKTVTLTFDTNVTGSWDDSGSNIDSFVISSNGSQVDNLSYDGESTNSYSYDVTLDENGQAQLTFTANTTGGNELIDISNISAELSVTSTDISTDEDTSVTIDVLANDTDANNDSLSVIQIENQDASSGQSINITNSLGTIIGIAAVVDGKIVFTPGDELDSLDEGESQDVNFSYTISDGAGGTDSANVSLTVTGLSNDALGTTLNYSGDLHSQTLNNVDGFGDNRDTLNVSDDIQGTSNISMYDGADTINVSDDIKDNTIIDMGAGADTINVSDDIKNNAQIDTGSGDDTITVAGNIENDAIIDMGSGSDTLNVGGDIKHDASIDMGAGDDTIHMLDTDGSGSGHAEIGGAGGSHSGAQLDFGDGLDTLIIEDDIDFNFDNLTLDGSSNNQISNLEVIDMQNGSGNNDLGDLELSDVLNMTDDDNILKILGDSGDELGLNITGEDLEWIKSDSQTTEDGEEFDVWVNASNDVKLYVDDDITINDI